MKKVIMVLVVASMLGAIVSCSKEKIIQAEENEALSVMTNGAWLITKFTEDDKNITSVFLGYECHFSADKTCIATRGTETVAGTWNASVSSRTITGWFPENAQPLSKITGTWKVVKANYTFAEFSQTKNGVVYDMEMTKK